MHKQDEAAWWICEGTKNKPILTRRQAVQGTAAAALAAWTMTYRIQSALAQVRVNPIGTPRGDVFVLLFLRGGADGLSIIVPHGDADYYRNRATIGLPPPIKQTNTAPAKPGTDKITPKEGDKTIDLDGFFGLHPALGSLYPLYADGLLAPVHAVGSMDRTRSHFEAMATMERGLGGEDGSGMASGWLARHLDATKTTLASPLRAVAWGDLLPDSLRGAMDVSVLSSLNDFRLNVAQDDKTGVGASLAALYGNEQGDDAVTRAGQETLATLDALKKLDPSHYKPANGAIYPTSALGDGFRQTACLIKGEVGLEVAALDRGGWDTHVGQGTSVGWLPMQLSDVGDSLAAFARDLGSERMQNVTVVVMTEFGRRVRENTGLGTDHGRASALLAIGGGLNGGKVYAKWPGLADDKLETPGDLKVTTDYRDVLGEIARLRLGNSRADSLFPDHKITPVGVAKVRKA